MRSLALVLGVGAVIASWYFVDEFAVDLLILWAYLFSPWALLAFGAGSLGSVARGVALFLVTAMTVGMYVTIARDDSSTAALGLLWLPLGQWLAIGVVVAFEGTRLASAPRPPR